MAFVSGLIVVVVASTGAFFFGRSESAYEPCGKSHGNRGKLESNIREAAMSGGMKEGDKRSCECERAGLCKVP